jgi:riboflavin biosynthesis pyrimidine reductase
LFTEDNGDGLGLPEPFRALYPGDWRIPERNGRSYLYTDFALSRDGRITYAIPGLAGGSDVTQSNPHDLWFMAFLRMRADAIMNGDRTVNLEGDSLWTAEALWPADAAAFAEVRQAEGRRPEPILVILSFDGHINFDAACFQRPESHIVLATTTQGAAHAQGFTCPATFDVVAMGETAVDLPRLTQMLYSDYGVKTLLSEGGAHVMAGLLAAKLVDEEFVTWCPTFVGRTPDAFRPSYTEGVAWRPETTPYSKPISLHRAGDLLFMRTRCLYDLTPV